MSLIALAALAAPIPAAAHEVWVERDASGPARIYLGEPNEAVPDAGDPEFPRLKAPKVSQGTNKAVATVRPANHIEAAVPGIEAVTPRKQRRVAAMAREYLALYQQAIAHHYRFFSYGDASLLE